MKDDLKLVWGRRRERADKRQLYVTLETVQRIEIARRVLKGVSPKFHPGYSLHIHEASGKNRKHRPKMLMQTRACRRYAYMWYRR